MTEEKWRRGGEAIDLVVFLCQLYGEVYGLEYLTFHRRTRLLCCAELRNRVLQGKPVLPFTLTYVEDFLDGRDATRDDRRRVRKELAEAPQELAEQFACLLDDTAFANLLNNKVLEQHLIPRISQPHFIRDIFGNPFRPVAFDPEWRTSNVVSLAKSMYESRDFSAMPILSDALQDAGCEHADILDHCRGTGPHVRGCWVVDHILGKE